MKSSFRMSFARERSARWVWSATRFERSAGPFCHRLHSTFQGWLAERSSCIFQTGTSRTRWGSEAAIVDLVAVAIRRTFVDWEWGSLR